MSKAKKGAGKKVATEATVQTQMALESVAVTGEINEAEIEAMLSGMGDEQEIIEPTGEEGATSELEAVSEAALPVDATASTGDAELDAELAALDGEPTTLEAAVASGDPQAVVDAAMATDLPEGDLEAAIGDLEREEQMQAHYAEQESGGDLNLPADNDDCDALAAGVAAKPAKKKTGGTRQYFATKSDRINAHLGDKQTEYLLLEMADAELDEAGQKAKVEEVKAQIDACAKKVGEKVCMLLDWMMKGGELNEVMKRTFTLLHQAGELTSGDEGNLHKNLLAKPYSTGTARSQGNQMFVLLPMLKIAHKEKGKVTRLTPNEDSLIWLKVKAELGLA